MGMVLSEIVYVHEILKLTLVSGMLWYSCLQCSHRKSGP